MQLYYRHKAIKETEGKGIKKIISLKILQR